MSARLRRVGVALASSVGGLAVTAVAAQQTIRWQARVARRAIGKQLGEEAHMADKLYKKSYGDPVRLLLLGDSIAAGLGAEKPKHTLGAQLAKALAKGTHRSVHLHTAARVGSETSMLRAQLAGLPRGYAADVAVIIVGGNDVTHRVRTNVSTRHLAEAITSLRERGTAVVVGTCPDLGALAAVPQPLRTLARRASRQLATAQREVTTELGGHAVSLAHVVGPFFITQPDEMFAIDRFHPLQRGLPTHRQGDLAQRAGGPGERGADATRTPPAAGGIMPTRRRGRVAVSPARIGQRAGSPKDLDAARQRVATEDTARFIDEHMTGTEPRRGADPHQVKLQLLADAVSLAPAGMALELGVATASIRSKACRRLPKRSAHP